MTRLQHIINLENMIKQRNGIEQHYLRRGVWRGRYTVRWRERERPRENLKRTYRNLARLYCTIGRDMAAEKIEDKIRKIMKH